MNPYWQNLRSELKPFVKEQNVTWRSSEYEIFFEVEALLYLHEKLVPDSADRNSENTWTLVSGHFITDVLRSDDLAKRSILNLRRNIRYVKASTSWRYWLKWYQEQALNLRLYRFNLIEDHQEYEQRSGVVLRNERLSNYESLYKEILPTTKPERDAVKPDTQYTFFTDEQLNSVILPDAIAQYPLTDKIKPIPIHPKTENTDIDINLVNLLDVAEQVDYKEAEMGLPSSDFYERLKPLQFFVPSDNGVDTSSHIRINGLFHLVGALGVGKSTIIKLLVYHLATNENRHVSIIMNTVVEAYGMAQWLRLMGIKATPALGRNRASHAQRVGFANQDIFNPQLVFQDPNPDEPLYRWMPKPCTLSAIAERPIPLGQEPCRNLRDTDRNRYDCPLLSVCPVHQITRDLHESQVWILNPASFIYSHAPDGIGSRPMRLAEAVYHKSDLLIIDEADRVQANWDHAFAPSDVVIGTKEAFIDWLHLRLGSMTTGENRNQLSRSTIVRLSKMDAQCHILANRAYNLFTYGRKGKLVHWVENRQLTNESIFRGLLNDLGKKFPKTMKKSEKEERLKTLLTAFKTYWKYPLRREKGFLADWLNEFLGGDVTPKIHDKKLDEWLTSQMGWQNITAKERLMCRRLDLAITLTALIKRINDIRHQLRWVEDEFHTQAPSQNAAIPDVLQNIMPEPPLGQILGLRIITSPKNDNRSFHTMRYRGVGRWLMLNFHNLFKERDGVIGPHVLLTSATSWMPESAIYHIGIQAQAILSNKNASNISSVNLRFTPIVDKGQFIRVSGVGTENKEHNLKRIIRALTPDIEKELKHWQKKDQNRCVLLVVNSYEQANWVLEEIQKTSNLHERVIRLFPDDSEIAQFGIRTREVEEFHKYSADVLIAPLMAIQRGFNILDEIGNALLGTAFFLVRPFPPPHDLTPQIMSLNAWYLKQLKNYGRELNTRYTDSVEGVQAMRLQAQRQWIRRLKSKGSLASMDDDLYQEFLRDSFVTIWQTVGRMIRGGSSARVFFVDEAFSGERGERNMLDDWHHMLGKLFETDQPYEKKLAEELYRIAWDAFDRAKKQRKI